MPRIWTRPLRELTPETSLGFEVANFAENVLGIELYPWQRWMLIHSLELLPDGRFRFRKVMLLVGRQNGKSTLLQILSLWRLYLDNARLVLGTAQERSVARDQWLGAVEIAQSVPDLAAEVDAPPTTTRGFERFALQSGEEYRIAASSRRAGRGSSVDLVLMDELREHTNWDAWAAVSKTTNGRPRGQVWGVSNAGDASSVVLRHFRWAAHAQLGDPDGLSVDPVTGESSVDLDDDAEEDQSLGIFEWSAPPGCSVWDRGGWAQSNPALGYGAVEEATLASDAANDPEWTFRTEVMCQWSDGALVGPFPTGTWDAGRLPVGADGMVASKIVGDVVAGIDVSVDRSRAWVAVAGRTTEGIVQVEIAARRAGTDWLQPWLQSRDFMAVTGQSKGAPVSPVMEELSEAGLPVVDMAGPDVPSATAALFDLVRASTTDGPAVLHTPQPALDVAAATAVPKMTDSGAMMWDRKRSPHNIAPLVAATGAVWLVTRQDERPAVSAYETRGLLTI